MSDIKKMNDFDGSREIDSEELSAVSGGTEWIAEDQVPGETDAFRRTRKEYEDQTPGVSGTDLIGAGVMDRTALSLDRLKESLTKSALQD